jgi:hypothetical protein
MPNGPSDEKRDWFGDDLIIDGQDKNMTFYYNGTAGCTSAENGCAFRIHGNDNIVRNVTWNMFPDGLHMRAGYRNLIENVTVSEVCEDAMTMNGANNACQDCVFRNPTTSGASDKALQNTCADGDDRACPSRVVIVGHTSTDDSQPTRVNRGDYHGLQVYRKGNVSGNNGGCHYSGENNMIIFEDNVCTTTKSSSSAGFKMDQNGRAIVRHNQLNNSNSYGILVGPGDHKIRAYYNSISGNGGAGVYIGNDTQNLMDFGGGAVDVWDQAVPAHAPVGIVPNQFTRDGCAVVSSCGQNTITGNGGYDIDNLSSTTVMAENNFWDHTTVSGVETNDVDGSVDVDPLGVDID